MGDLMPDNPGVDPYKFLTRKVFDKVHDRLDLRIARIKQDYRADVAAVLRRVQNLERQWSELFPIEEQDEPSGDSMDPHHKLCLCDDCTSVA